MKNDWSWRYFWPVGLLALFLTAANAFLQVPGGEGFNPSDDGVILAQSYRLLQGEVPHRDFISIRPVGSAVMHLIHFFSPLPLVISSRWMVLLAYFLISLLFALAWLPYAKILRSKNGRWFFAGLVLLQFLLTENHYNLFPWTTVDALLWAGVALLAWSRLEARPDRRVLVKLFCLFWGITAAALCRQTFLLPGLLLAIVTAWRYLFKMPVGSRGMLRWGASLAGALPGWVYIGFLTITGSWGNFLTQMTGRTEFWETGIRKFSDNFWGTPVWGAFMVVFVIALLIRWSDDDTRLIFLAKKLLSAGHAVLMVLILLVTITIFLIPNHLFAWSFIFFWLVLLQILMLKVFPLNERPRMAMAWWILLIAWTSSLSLGDNAPVFATGILAGAGILLFLESFTTDKLARWPVLTSIIAALFLAGLTLISFRAQQQNNYRDLPADELSASLGEVFPGLKGVRSTEVMRDYLSEIRMIYDELGSPTGRLAVWPNNALIYALLESPNPFPLDWMQAAEYPGNEKRLYQEISRTMSSGTYYILLERYNVKWIANQRIPIQLESTDHPYLGMMKEWAVERPIDSRWFRLFVSRQ